MRPKTKSMYGSIRALVACRVLYGIKTTLSGCQKQTISHKSALLQQKEKRTVQIMVFGIMTVCRREWEHIPGERGGNNNVIVIN